MYFKFLCVFVVLLAGSCRSQKYYGKLIGKISELQHDVRGEVYAVDSRTFHIRNFAYDGTAPDAFFYVGTSGVPSDVGTIVPDENGSTAPLSAYRGQHLTLTLPEGVSLKDIVWMSIWCRAFQIDFGNVKIPRNFDYPRPRKVGAIRTLDHGTKSDEVVVVDAQTFLIPNFYYDGTAPDAHFWVGKGTKPGNSGKIVPDENGNMKPLKQYSGKTIVLTLPGDMTVFDIDHFSVWCRAFLVDFGHLILPRNLNVPPSLKMLGIAPQTKLNCEVLWDNLAYEVRWAVAGESIVMQLVGKVDSMEYMSFGLSGHESRSVMIGSDVIVAWLDQATGQGEARDYSLMAKSQCQGGVGTCPDSKIRAANDNVRLLNSAIINGFTMLTFQRPLRAIDANDKAIRTNSTQAVVWAIGPINSEGDAGYHKLRQRGDVSVDFGRAPNWNCPLPDGGDSNSNLREDSGPITEAPSANPWFIPEIPCYEPEDGIFYAQIGPSGGTNGYNAITQRVGWGIAWYINGLLIPEITLVRGKEYTFVVEGGSNPSNAAKFHPFYITDDPEGGFEFKSPAERSAVRVFAGLNADQSPSATGRLCEWKETPGQRADKFTSFGAYQRTLKLECKEGEQGFLKWTPDRSTPDTVYYQCYTHRYLGWKINVVDACTTSAGGLARVDTSDYYFYDDYFDSLKTDSRKTQMTNINDKIINRGRGSRYNINDGIAQEKMDRGVYPYVDDPLYDDILTRTATGFSSFKFTKLPSLQKPSDVVNYTAFSNLRSIPGLIPSTYQFPVDQFDFWKEEKDNKAPIISEKITPLTTFVNNRSIISDQYYEDYTPSFIRDLNSQFTKKNDNTTNGDAQLDDHKPPVRSKEYTNIKRNTKGNQPLYFPGQFKHTRMKGPLKRKRTKNHSKNQIPVNYGGKPIYRIKNKYTQPQKTNTIRNNLPSSFLGYKPPQRKDNTKGKVILVSPKSTFVEYGSQQIGFDPSSVVYETDFRPVGKVSLRDPLYPKGLARISNTWINQEDKNSRVKSNDDFVPLHPKEKEDEDPLLYIFDSPKRRNLQYSESQYEPSLFLKPPPLPVSNGDSYFFKRSLKKQLIEETT